MTTVKYHVSKNGSVNPCKAEEKPCPLKEHFALSYNVDASGQTTLKAYVDDYSIPAPKKVEKKAPIAVKTVSHYAPAYHAYKTFSQNSSSRYNPVDNLDYDNLPADEEVQLAGHGTLNLQHMAYHLARTSSPTYAPEGLAQALAASEWSKPESWKLVKKSRKDFVTEEEDYARKQVYDLQPNDHEAFKAFIAAQRQSYWAAPNANDDEGVLSYLRSQGYDTSGSTPIQAVQGYLAESYGNQPVFKKMRRIRRSWIAVSKLPISIPENQKQAYAKTKPVGLEGQSRYGRVIGIVIQRKHPETNEMSWTLLSGFDRHKGANHVETKDGKFTTDGENGEYLILEQY